MDISVAVIFDLDGTLTVPNLDFDDIRRELGLDRVPVLEAMAKMDAEHRAQAAAVLERHEKRAAHESQLQEGARETLAALRGWGIKTAILTRNARRWVDVVLAKHGLAVDAIRTRDNGAIKPSAEPVLSLCRELKCEPAVSWMVGDYLFDIESGRSAGCRTALLVGAGAKPDFADRADYVLGGLRELLALVCPEETATGRR
ncbi:MAG: HAD family hydrolase [Phycisphaerae bacterium]